MNDSLGNLTNLLDFLCQLKRCNIHFTLEHNRDETIMVMIAVPGECWEVEFFADGHLDVEVFRSVNGVVGKKELERLFRDFSD